MVKRLEQVAALVVAAGLALVSYWLFFSWSQGGRSDRLAPRSLTPTPEGTAAELTRPQPQAPRLEPPAATTEP
ncbi:hypothetical protein KBY97_11560 [Synechococcus sp. ATX 2A4]|uniref:hypothetical protein n=1 Tax=Synechococcus sp. ATX 2A4 TaxID=2823727 RepID=UPI0020CE5890|nr:hypothetical protein [Synechococcus sp. ATX 2A4]MCP9885752.1 hypothetical protein [Synechococcus sp. ATX 2A4]